MHSTVAPFASLSHPLFIFCLACIAGNKLSLRRIPCLWGWPVWETCPLLTAKVMDWILLAEEPKSSQTALFWITMGLGLNCVHFITATGVFITRSIHYYTMDAFFLEGIRYFLVIIITSGLNHCFLSSQSIRWRTAFDWTRTRKCSEGSTIYWEQLAEIATINRTNGNYNIIIIIIRRMRIGILIIIIIMMGI